MQFKSLTYASLLLLAIGFCLHSANGQGARTTDFHYENTGNNYNYKYQTDEGISQAQSGEIAAGATIDFGGTNVKGSASWISPEGYLYTLTYTADQNGYLPVFTQTQPQ